MSELDEYLTKYITERAVSLEKYVLEAFDSEEKRYLCSETNQDLKNLKFLQDAEIFQETTLISKDSGNYRVFCLTEKGQHFATQLKKN